MGGPVRRGLEDVPQLPHPGEAAAPQEGHGGTPQHLERLQLGIARRGLRPRVRHAAGQFQTAPVQQKGPKSAHRVPSRSRSLPFQRKRPLFWRHWNAQRGFARLPSGSTSKKQMLGALKWSCVDGVPEGMGLGRPEERHMAFREENRTQTNRRRRGVVCATPMDSPWPGMSPRSGR